MNEVIELANTTMRIIALALLALGNRSQAFSTITFHNYRFYQQSTSLKMSKKVLVPIADDSEEIETACITDVLTRFGANVTIASVMPGKLLCKMSRGMKVEADASIEDVAKQEFDMIVCPGGMPGAAHLRDSKTLISMLEKQKADDKHYAAICAAPAVVLAPNGLLDEIEGATCYPSEMFREKLKNPVDNDVAVMGNVTTSKGPGTSLAFALELGEQLYGKEIRDKIQKEMLIEL